MVKEKKIKKGVCPKDGDVIDFIGLEWQEPQWEFDHPTVILKPLISYSPNGESAEKMIEDMCIDLCITADDIQENSMLDEDVSKEFGWRRWNLSRMKTVASNRLNGGNYWVSKYPRVIKQRIKFFVKDGETNFKILSTKRA